MFFAESINTIKIRVFAKKIRYQNIEFWPNGKHFRDDKKMSEISEICRELYFFCHFRFFLYFGILDIAFNA